ncbi:MAG: sugar ABC transporter substrate-binding protein [Bosea sp.]|nr:sugar ABC transporter substrate-binding protein [Bosea sp. (in: a-proteobacteria)]
MRKLVLAAAAAVALSGGAQADPITLSVWGIDNQTGSGNPGYTQIMVDEWNAKHDDVKLEYRFVAFDDANNDFARAIATNSGPDIFMINTTDTQFYAARDVLVDLTDRIAASSVIKPSDIFPGYLAAITYNDRIWEVPKAADTIALYYNPDMFKAAGLDPDKPPRSWQELHDYAKALTKPDQGVFGIAFSAKNGQEGPWQWLPFVRMTGEDWTNVDTDGARRALTLWKTFVDEGLASKEVLVQAQSDAADMFRAGKAAMVLQGNWDLPNMEGLPFKYRLALLPPEKEGGLQVSAAGNFTYGINKQSAHPDEAFKFIEYVYSQQDRNWNEFGLLPAYAFEAKDPKWPDAYKVFTEQLKFGRVLGPSPRWNDVSIALQTAIQSALSGQSDVDSALKRAAAEIETIKNEQ